MCALPSIPCAPQIAALSVFSLNNLLRLIGTFSAKAFAKQGAWQKQVQTALEYVKPVVDNLFGASATTGGFKVELTHLLLAAVLIALVGIWRTLHINGQLAKAALKTEGEDGKEHKHGKGKAHAKDSAKE